MITNETQTTMQDYYSMKNIETSIDNVYSNRTSFSGTINKINAQNVQETLNSLSTDYSKIENLKPSDISFKDYSKLTYESLEVLFNGESKNVGIASGLMAKAQLTDDITLNQIFFDKDIESKNKDENDTFQDVLMAIAPMKLKLDPNVGSFSADGSFHFKSDFTKNTSHTGTELSSEKAFSTKEQLFLDFENLKHDSEERYRLQSGVFDMNKIFKTIDEIKALYEQKVEENNTIINNYSRTNILA